ncbi:MAG: hypothetical protein LBV02_08570 [Bacteroidales bacterium]|jgi:signal transduction histidine kinase/tetratricopeptide (TPR) repeat protein|nr:hypothetical protein [Bacteroidales bacterium]
MKHITALIIALCFATSALANSYGNQQTMDSLENILATKQPKGEELANLYSDLMWGYSRFDIEKSVFYIRKQIALCEKEKIWMPLSEAYRQLGISYLKLGREDSIMYYLDKALQVIDEMEKEEKYSEQNIDDVRSKTYGSIGQYYGITGKYRQATEYFIKALKIFEKQGWKRDEAITHSNIGQNFVLIGNTEEAMKHFKKLKEIGEEIEDYSLVMYGNRSMGSACLAMKEYDNALKYAQEAYRFLENHPEDVQNHTTVSNIMAMAYLEKENSDLEAEKYAVQALELARKTGFMQEKAKSLVVLASVYMKKNDWKKAIALANDALACNAGENEINLKMYELLTKSYSYLHMPDKAAVYFNLFSELQISHSNSEFQQSLAEMLTKYENEKKQLKIEEQQQIIEKHTAERIVFAAGLAAAAIILVLLCCLLRLRKKRNRELAEMNATKDKFFSIISHDLKNPAIAQRNALQQLLDYSDNFDENKRLNYYRELLKSADNQAELLHNLLNWTQLQTGRMPCNPVKFDLSSALRSDIAIIQNLAERKQIDFEVHIPDVAIVFADRNILNIVIRNLLTNAVKFTGESGKITLVIEQTGDKHIVSVTDTGTGMTHKTVQNLFDFNKTHTTLGTLGESGSGLGLIVCKELLEKNNAQLRIESEIGKGSRFWFAIH